MTNNRLLVVGASGFLGHVLCDTSVDGWEQVPASRSGRENHVYIDLTQPNSIRAAIEKTNPKWVINAAAMTSVDGCERDPDLARAIHIDGTQSLVAACEAVGCGLVNVSTNYVFDGKDGPYKESDPAHPVNVYGQTKLESERILLQAQCPAIVVRTAVLYGFRAACRPNFVTWAISALARDEAIRVVTDEWANPTFVDELARFILLLCQTDFLGVVHFGGADFLTRFEMVERICAVMGFDFSLVSAITSEAFGQPAERPLRAGLMMDLATSICDVTPDAFDDVLLHLKPMIPQIIS